MNDEYGVVTEPATFRIERLLPGPIERVWAFCTESEKRGKWFAAGPLELKVGGRGRWIAENSKLSPTPDLAEFRNDMKVPLDVTVLDIDPPRLLVMQWNAKGNETEVTFELEARGDNVLLVVTHSRVTDPALLLGIAGGWHVHLGILLDLFHGRAIPPFWSTHARMVKEYEARINA
ncbi:MAG TPA: SRPBCC family protein [Burkholderiales bacterium]|nr:SRPBCC family protein [Burkholderiales bacterium]